MSELIRHEPVFASTSHACGGACCESFTLPYPPIVLVASAEATKRLADPEFEWPSHVPMLEDIVQIAEMVDYIGEFDHPPHETVHAVEHSHLHYYRCRNLGEDGLCTIYERRPQMCRAFPYGRRCNYARCGATCRVDPDDHDSWVQS